MMQIIEKNTNFNEQEINIINDDLEFIIWTNELNKELLDFWNHILD
jgi:hypothetical protein